MAQDMTARFVHNHINTACVSGHLRYAGFPFSSAEKNIFGVIPHFAEKFNNYIVRGKKAPVDIDN